jgi:ABC-type glycerol-3-phosphate transport system permease component
MPTVYSFVGQFSTDQSVLLASAVLASLILLLFFFVLQRQIIAGILAGAVKG